MGRCGSWKKKGKKDGKLGRIGGGFAGRGEGEEEEEGGSVKGVQGGGRGVVGGLAGRGRTTGGARRW